LKAHEFIYDYSEKRDFSFALFSDLHVDAKHCQRDKLQKALEEAYQERDAIFLNGDVFSCLMPKDYKRFTLAHAFGDRDDILDYMIDYVAEFLSPYADKIKIIGMGNHESSALKFHGTNPIARLCRQLKDSGGDAKFGDYQNFIRLKFRHGDNDSVRAYNIWMCHGMGAGAKRSRGALEWDLVYSRFDADLYWMGHNHQSEIDNSGSYTRINRALQIVTKPKRGIRTPAWEETISVREPEDPYDIKYGEERHGLPVALPGYGVLEISLAGDGLKDRLYLI